MTPLCPSHTWMHSQLEVSYTLKTDSMLPVVTTVFFDIQATTLSMLRRPFKIYRKKHNERHIQVDTSVMHYSDLCFWWLFTYHPFPFTRPSPFLLEFPSFRTKFSCPCIRTSEDIGRLFQLMFHLSVRGHWSRKQTNFDASKHWVICNREASTHWIANKGVYCCVSYGVLLI